MSSITLAELGEISKGSPRYIKNLISGASSRPAGAETGRANEVYRRVQQKVAGTQAGRAKKRGDTIAASHYQGQGQLHATGKTAAAPSGPNLQERLKAFKAQKAANAPAPAPAPVPVVEAATKTGMSRRNKMLIGGGVTTAGLAGGGGIAVQQRRRRAQ